MPESPESRRAICQRAGSVKSERKTQACRENARKPRQAMTQETKDRISATMLARRSNEE